jgi:hypothetical protein
VSVCRGNELQDHQQWSQLGKVLLIFWLCLSCFYFCADCVGPGAFAQVCSMFVSHRCLVTVHDVLGLRGLPQKAPLNYVVCTSCCHHSPSKAETAACILTLDASCALKTRLVYSISQKTPKLAALRSAPFLCRRLLCCLQWLKPELLALPCLAGQLG